MTHRGGFLGQPGWVSRLLKVSFLHVNAEGGVLRLTGGDLSLGVGGVPHLPRVSHLQVNRPSVHEKQNTIEITGFIQQPW